MHASTSFDYRAAAKRVAAKLDETAVERDRNGNHPYEEVDLLRKEGLLELIAPKEFGGHGLRWQQSLEAVRIISAADGSIGQLLTYHYGNSQVPLLFGTVDQAEKHIRQQVLNQWYVADSVNPLSPSLAVTENDQGFVINGKITFSTGVPVSQRVIITPAYGGAEYFASVPTDRPGLIVNDDWDNIGLRQSASGSVTFANYQVLKEELFTKFEAGTKPNAFATLVTLFFQLGFVNFYLGIASGALDRAAEYTRNTSRPWFLSGVDHAVNDPYILSRYGSLVAELDASIALATQAAHKVQTAFDIGDSLSPDERAEAAFEVAKAKIHSTETALKITTKIFEVTGARATSRQYSFDRFWRNVRTHTLHDPVFYKEKEVGNYFLNGVKPEFTLYT